MIKFFETYTTVSLKFISILSECYNRVELIKPFMSRLSNSEKYIICMDFKYGDDSREYKNITSILLGILEKIHKNQEYQIADIFPEFDMSEEFINNFKKTNVIIGNENYKAINIISQFVKDQNYYGDKFQMGKEIQIEATKYWASMFLPEDRDLDKIKSKLQKLYL